MSKQKRLSQEQIISRAEARQASFTLAIHRQIRDQTLQSAVLIPVEKHYTQARGQKNRLKSSKASPALSGARWAEVADKIGGTHVATSGDQFTREGI